MAIKVFVGLGGFGTNVVKEMVLKMDDTNTKFNDIGIVFFDSSTEELNVIREKLKERNNFKYVSISHGDSVSKVCESFYKDLEDFEVHWPGFQIGKKRCETSACFTGEGFGQSRPKGLLGLFKHLRDDSPESIVDFIFTVYNNLLALRGKDQNRGQGEIILVNSLGGGTGSSTFIDIAYLIRDLFSKNNLNPPKIILCSALGDVATKDSNEEFLRRWSYANTFASLYELDFWIQNQNFSKSYLFGDSVNIVNINSAPYDFVFLMGAYTDDDGNLNKRAEYISLMASFLFEFTIRQSIALNQVALFDNFLQNLSPGEKFGSFGVGYLIYPKKDVIDWFFYSFLEDYIIDFIKGQKKDAIKKFVDQAIDGDLVLVPKFGFTNDNFTVQIKSSYTDKFGREIHFPSNISFSGFNKNRLNEVENFLKDRKENVTKFLEGKKDIYLDTKCKILEELVNKCSIDEGIGFANGFLEDLIERLKGYENRVDNELKKMENIDLENLNREYQEVKDLLFKKNFWGAEKRINNFKVKFVKYIELIDKIEILNFKKLALKNVREHAEKILKGVNRVHSILDRDVKAMISGKKDLILKELYTNYSLNYDFLVFVLRMNKHSEFYENVYKKMFLDNVGKNLNENEYYIKLLIKDLEKIAVSFLFDISGKLKVEEYTTLNSDQIMLLKNNVIKKLMNFKEQFEKILWNLKRAGRNSDDYFLPENILEALFLEYKMEISNSISFDNFQDFCLRKIDELKKKIKPWIKLKTKMGRGIAYKFYVDQDVLNNFNQTNKDSVLKINQLGLDQVNDLSSELIVGLETQKGFSLNNLSDFKGGKFELAFLNRENEVFTDLRAKPGKEQYIVLFLLSEYYGIIEKNKTKETGIYKFRNNPLQKGLKGRKNVIEWFKNNIYSYEIKAILDKLSEEWKKVPENEKKNVLRNIKEGIEKKLKSQKMSNELRAVYEDNLKVIENALQQNFQKRIDDLIRKLKI